MEFPGSPVVRPQYFQFRSPGSILGWGPGVPKATQLVQRGKKVTLCESHNSNRKHRCWWKCWETKQLPNVKQNQDSHSSILLTTGASGFFKPGVQNWCFWIVVLEKTLESFLDFKIKPVHPKGNQSWIFIRRTDAEAEGPVLWPNTLATWF